MRNLLFIRAAIILVIAGTVSGCSDGLPRQATYKVTGQVTLDGKPVPGATLVFHPIDASKFKWQERPQAKTDDQGNFTVTTYQMGDGAPAAEYRVGIAVLAGGDDEGNDQQKRSKQVRLPQKYASHETSGVTAKVEARETRLEPFALRSKP